MSMAGGDESSGGPERELTAIHEAGHAWAYRRAGLPLRYVSLRPRRPGMVGICQPWGPRWINVGVKAVIASAGPIAQAHYSMTCDPESALEWNGVEWADCLMGAIWSGGDDDYEVSLGMLDDAELVALLRHQIVDDWHDIERLAERLLTEGTISGRDAFELLGVRAGPSTGTCARSGPHSPRCVRTPLPRLGGPASSPRASSRWKSNQIRHEGVDMEIDVRFEDRIDDPTMDNGRPMMTWGQDPSLGYGWQLYYLDDPSSPTAGVDMHFIGGDITDVGWALEQAKAYLDWHEQSIDED